MKVFRITKTDAKIAMLRMDTSSMVMMVMALIIFMLTKLYTIEAEIVYIAIIFLLVSAAVLIGVSVFAKSEIQAMNIIDWPFKKYIEVKDE